MGAIEEDSAGSGAGAVYVLGLTGSGWSEEQKLTASDAAANDKFGRSVSIFGSVVFVGAYGKTSHTGAVYTFQRTCQDTDGCSLFGGGTGACGSVANSQCLDTGVNTRTCACATGFTGVTTATGIADSANTFSGTCSAITCDGSSLPGNSEIVNGCTSTDAYNSDCQIQCVTGYSASAGLSPETRTCTTGTYSGSGLTCSEIDACINNPCGTNADCVDLPAPALDNAAGRTCNCHPGYTVGTGSNGQCLNVNPYLSYIFTSKP